MRENTTRGRPPPALALDEPDFDHLSQAPEPLVRAILMTLCDDDRVKAKALRYFDRLLRFESESQDGPEDLRSPTSGVPTKNPRKRRKTGDPKICVQCDSIFLEEENQFGICKYHAGECDTCPLARAATWPRDGPGFSASRRVDRPP